MVIEEPTKTAATYQFWTYDPPPRWRVLWRMRYWARWVMYVERSTSLTKLATALAAEHFVAVVRRERRHR